MKHFDNWEKYEDASEGSGRSKKIWLINPENSKIGLFKYPKEKDTKECISEKLASQIAKLIGVDCAEIEIGQYQSIVGCMSYNIRTQDIQLIEGIGLINKILPSYDPEKLFDPVKKQGYTLSLNLDAIKEFNLEKDFLCMCIFDFLIGNSDRHQSNWAILKGKNSVKMCPLYDNGSSICCYVKEKTIASYLGNDKVKFASLIDSKSKSMIKLNDASQKTSHKKVVEYICNHHFNSVEELIERIFNVINEDSINDILSEYTENLLSKERKMLICKFLLGKIDILKELIEKRGG